MISLRLLAGDKKLTIGKALFNLVDIRNKHPLRHSLGLLDDEFAPLACASDNGK